MMEVQNVHFEIFNDGGTKCSLWNLQWWRIKTLMMGE